MKTTLIFKGWFVIVLVLLGNTAFAQWESVFNADYFSDGTLKSANKNTHYGPMEGSPYFLDKWVNGTARLSDGKTYDGLFLKFDELTQTLMFKYDMKDSTMVFKYRPLEFKMEYVDDKLPYTAHFLNGFDAIDKGNNYTFYKVLSEGKVMLLKKTTKTITETQRFGSNETVRIVQTKTSYYLANGTHLAPVNPTEKAFIAALGTKADKIKAYIKVNNIDMNDDTNLAAVVDYYNTL